MNDFLKTSILSFINLTIRAFVANIFLKATNSRIKDELREKAFV